MIPVKAVFRDSESEECEEDNQEIQNFCTSDVGTVGDLDHPFEEEEVAISWYATKESTTPIDSTVLLEDELLYWRKRSLISIDPTDRVSVFVKIYASPPLEEETRQFNKNDSPTIADLGTDDGLVWYDSEISIISLLPELPIEDGVTYYGGYADQVPCRIPVTVSLVGDGPTDTSIQSFCSVDTPTIADLLLPVEFESEDAVSYTHLTLPTNREE